MSGRRRREREFRLSEISFPGLNDSPTLRTVALVLYPARSPVVHAVPQPAVLPHDARNGEEDSNDDVPPHAPVRQFRMKPNASLARLAVDLGQKRSQIRARDP